MTTLLWLLSWHWVADFVLQSDWMATEKSKSWEALSAHVFVYTVVMSFAFSVIVAAMGYPQHTLVPAFMGATFATHFLTDAITSRITYRLWTAQERHWFFVVIGADQLIHAWTLALTGYWILR